MNPHKNRLAAFFKVEYRQLVGYVNRRIDRAADRDPEDIVQDVFLHLFEKADVTAPIENLAAYIYRSLRNRITDRFRKRNPEVSLETKTAGDEAGTLLDVLPDLTYHAGEVMEKKEMTALMHAAIGELSPDEQAVIIETEFNKRTFKELAETWQVPPGTLLARKSRALKKIRARIGHITQ